MLKEFKADLHIHSCLSPCADIDMSPSAIVRTACDKGIDIIAVTDHNSAENVEAAKRAAEGRGLAVLAGMEVSTQEEVHILALFNDTESIMELQGMVYDKLMPGENNPELFGEQVVADEKDNVLGFNKRLLIAGTGISIESLTEAVHSMGGLAIASHIDREGFGIIHHLGFIPPDLGLDALEVSSRVAREEADKLFSDYLSYTSVSFSDAHRLADIGRRTTLFSMEAPTLSEIAASLKKRDGREAVWR